MGGQAVEYARVSPRQRRAQATVDAILEAAIQVLERDGEAGFNTNAVAERAGVGIGSVYRYFPDKDAILTALAEREMRAQHERAALLVAGDRDGLALDRALIRAFLQAFEGRSQARRVIVHALLARADARDLAAGYRATEGALKDAAGRPLDRIRFFVLTRALNGAMRAAVLEDQDFLFSREFEDQLVRMSRAYLGYQV